MKLSGFLVGALLSALLASTGCTAEDAAPDYRYRLTVEVDTPEGLRTGSSVIEVQRAVADPVINPSASILRTRIRGEAVAVDLPGGQTLYALLGNGQSGQWAAAVVPLLAPDAQDDNPFDDVLLLEGKQELPRTWPPVGHIGERPAYPMLVTFGDEADPTSVARVDPDDLAASFGEGVELKRITAELTDDPVTTGIEERLGWLAETEGAIGKIPMSERPPSGIALPLHATLSETAFRKGAKK
ncbi:hypothetical protein EH31_13690 [Erythrobacter longus]|uniref:Lipoprotein n=1 Tax=Erythrobacter longus TaxID=1044 RepID=A0A074M3D2_ERYLO|nr:hypothetical protein [Erythrobacter longus]KEO89086.1 hypothetical protein EH31_13690 [Erythrobacter longus]